MAIAARPWIAITRVSIWANPLPRTRDVAATAPVLRNSSRIIIVIKTNLQTMQGHGLAMKWNEMHLG